MICRRVSTFVSFPYKQPEKKMFTKLRLCIACSALPTVFLHIFDCDSEMNANRSHAGMYVCFFLYIYISEFWHFVVFTLTQHTIYVHHVAQLVPKSRTKHHLYSAEATISNFELHITKKNILLA